MFSPRSFHIFELILSKAAREVGKLPLAASKLKSCSGLLTELNLSPPAKSAKDVYINGSI